MECSILIAGQAGTGLASVENQLITLLAQHKFYYFATKRYMSRIRGGSNRHMFRVSETPVNALSGKSWDLLVAFDGEGEIYRNELSKDGIYISQNDVAAIRARATVNQDDRKAANMVLAGHIFELIKKAVAPKAEHSFKIFGNQALSLGALAGGCQFMSGYPMTPSTSIMDYMTHAAETLPVHFEQAEDEIAAINIAIGASYAGLRAMTASSGGGFALMQEGVSLTAMLETPLVIAVSQRPAPATGMPTRTEQADLEFVLHAGHGEFSRAIYAPGDCDEAFAVAKKAFAVADAYQIPVFILTDQYLADSFMVVNNIPDVTISGREYKTYGAEYKRFAFTQDGISPLTYPGLSAARVCVDSDEHDEAGLISEDPVMRVKMQNKRLGKLPALTKEVLQPTVEGVGDSIVICWGSTKHIVREAVQHVNGAGHAVQFLHCAQVYPVSKMLQNLCAHKKVIVVEQNATGQFARLLKTTFGIDSISILKYDGDCFTVAEVEEKLHGCL